MKQHEQEIAALEASFEAEEARHTAEISKKLNETHIDNVQQAHRGLLEKVSSAIECRKRTPLTPSFLSLIVRVNTSFNLFLEY